jgi:hypothetical protein
MKVLMLILLLTAGTVCRANEPSIATVRSLLKKAATDKASCKQLITLLQPYTAQNNPLLYGYSAVANMLQAKHTFNPFGKLSHFKKGKAMLENAIMYAADNVELRMLRYAAQKKAPSFLQYNASIQEDEAFLAAALPRISDSYLKTEVAGCLQNTKNI